MTTLCPPVTCWTSPTPPSAPISSSNGLALPVPISQPAPAAAFLIVKLLLSGSKFVTWT